MNGTENCRETFSALSIFKTIYFKKIQISSNFIHVKIRVSLRVKLVAPSATFSVSKSVSGSLLEDSVLSGAGRVAFFSLLLGFSREPPPTPPPPTRVMNLGRVECLGVSVRRASLSGGWDVIVIMRQTCNEQKCNKFPVRREFPYKRFESFYSLQVGSTGTFSL